MLGNAVLRFFAQSPSYTAFGTVRSTSCVHLFPLALQAQLLTVANFENVDNLKAVFEEVRPHVVINCIGLVKQLAEAEDALAVIPINSLLPHQVARQCELIGARMVHISTDCVFSGTQGMYTEEDVPDAKDLYGRSKLLGEVNYPHTITLRTSIIGHELTGGRSLLGWFLSQTGQVKGYRRAVFSGLPTVEVARVIRDFVLPNPKLSGLYHLSASPINKCELLKTIASVYQKRIEIIPDDELVIDRSLNSSRFREKAAYAPPSWLNLINDMREFA